MGSEIASKRLKHDVVISSCKNRQYSKSTYDIRSDSNHVTMRTNPSACARRIIFPVIHNDSFLSAYSVDNTSCTTTQESSTSDAKSSKKTACQSSQQVVDLPTSILRRKTSSQSSLSVISEDGSYYLGSDLNTVSYDITHESKCISSSLSSQANISTLSIPSLISSHSLHINDFSDHHDQNLLHSSTCLKSCMKKQNPRPKCMGVSLDPRLWVHEYQPAQEELESDNWYNAAEIEDFKRGAIACIKEQETRYLDDFRLLKGFFNHPALVKDDSHLKSCNIKTEICNVLVVDPNALFLKLFKRGFQCMLPHASITTATSGEDALLKIKKKQQESSRGSHGYDIVVVEERLLPTFSMQQQYLRLYKNKKCTYDKYVHSSGSYLIQKLASERKISSNCNYTPYTLFIGVTGHQNEDRLRLSKSGADLIWNKPPPSMNKSLEKELLYLIVNKRNAS